MKKTIKFFAAALAIVAAASCAKEINVDTPADDSAEKVQMTFTASYDAEGETKTVLAENNFIHWTDNDAIRIFSKDVYGDWNMNDEVFVIDPSSNDADPTFADFSGNIVPSTSYYAASPADGWSVYNGATKYFQFEGLANQIAVKGSFDSSKHIALSVSLKNNHFYFQNACALLKVKIGKSLSDVYSIQVTGSKVETPFGEGALGGMLQFRVGDLYPTKTNMSPNSITLKNSNANEPLEKDVVYYIVVPVCDVENFTVTLFNEKGQALSTKSKSSKFEIKRNKIYDLGTFNYQLQVGDYYYSDGTTGVEYKSNAVGVVFYVGDPHEVDSTLPSQFTKGLVVGLKEYSNLNFGTNGVGSTMSLQPDCYGVNTYASNKYGANSVLDGVSKNIIGISNAYDMTLKHRKGEGGSKLYSSYGFGSVSGSGWLIPSAKEYSLMYKHITLLNSKEGFTDLQVWTTSDKSTNDSTYGEYVIGYHTVWQANIGGENGWRCLNYYYINSSNEGLAQIVSNTNKQGGSKGHIGRAFLAF